MTSDKQPYELKFRVRWKRLSGTDLWHRPGGSPHEVALCGNPSSGIVTTATTGDVEPPGPKCPKCEAAYEEQTT